MSHATELTVVSIYDIGITTYAFLLKVKLMKEFFKKVDVKKVNITLQSGKDLLVEVSIR